MTHQKLMAALLGATMLFSAAAEANPRSQRFLDKARDRIEAGDAQAALIELRNAVQADEKDWEVRHALGQLYLSLGRPDLAVEELKLVVENASTDNRELDYGRALASMRRFDEALAAVSPSAEDGQTRRRKLIFRGEVKRLNGDPDGALRDANSVLAEDPLNTIANYLAANVYQSRGQIVQAQERLDTIIQNDLNFAQAWVMKSQIATSSRDYAAAVSFAERALEIDPSNSMATILRIEGLMRSGAAEEAEAAIDKIAEANPRDPRAPFLRTLAAAAQGNFSEAENQLAQVGDAIDQMPNGGLLTGLVKFKTGNFGQAEQALAEFRRTNPENIEAGVLLAAVQTRRERFSAAEDTIREVLSQDPDNAAAHQLRSSIAMRQGKFDVAVGALEDAAAAGEQVSAGLVQMLGGGGDVLELDDIQKRMLTALDYLRADENDKALEIAADLAQSAPENPVVQNMLGSVHLARNEPEKARPALEKALEVNPAFFAALVNLDRLDARDGNYDAIEARLRRARGVAPDSLQIARRLAEFLYVRDHREEAITLLNAATDQVDEPYELLQLKAQMELSGGEAMAARATARKIAAIGDGRARTVAGAIYEQAGAPADAARLYTSLTDEDPKNIIAGVGQARALLNAGRSDDAIASLRSLIERAPETGAYREALAQFLVRNEKTAEAISVAETYRQREPVAGVLLEANVRETSGDRAGAIATLEAAQAATPNEEFARALLLARIRNGEREAGMTKIAEWLENNPSDADSQILYGTLLIEGEKYEEAERVLSAALRERPRSAILLNNLAWIRHNSNKAGAEDLARRAFALAPRNAEIADTLGWILYEKGEKEQALGILREAYEAGSDNGTIAFHLAKALVDDGEREEAASILSRALEASTPFGERAEAEALLQSLRA